MAGSPAGSRNPTCKRRRAASCMKPCPYPGDRSRPGVFGPRRRITPTPVSLPVRTTPEADAQIRDVDDWWRTNRPFSPNLFFEELIESFDIIGDAPHAADAWYVPNSVKTGYEISFTRYFYTPQPLRTLEEIRADILALEKETAGLLGEIIGGSAS